MSGPGAAGRVSLTARVVSCRPLVFETPVRVQPLVKSGKLPQCFLDCQVTTEIEQGSGIVTLG
jgi:hypothetical protein